MSDHKHGILYAVATLLLLGGKWFLDHLSTINSVLQFVVLALGILTGLIGLRKVMRR